jgi:hypothetical protein
VIVAIVFGHTPINHQKLLGALRQGFFEYAVRSGNLAASSGNLAKISDKVVEDFGALWQGFFEYGACCGGGAARMVFVYPFNRTIYKDVCCPALR